MTDYTKLKNAELENLLKERGLAHSGKKAELVKRLQEDDEQKTNTTAAPAASTATAKNEDEIDWDDEPAVTENSKPTTDASTAAVAAGGVGQVPNPQAVPNQEAAIDPSKTNDLTVVEPAPEASSATDAQPAAESAPVEEKPQVDFSAGIAKTTLEQEIEKRKARAKKFGLDESTDETLKNLERAKRFGGGDLPGRLNEALPERREKKRGREAPEDTTSAAAGARKRTRPGPGPRKGDGRKEGGKPAGAKPAGGAGSWMSEADSARAEARKAKFATAT
ncbi:hypothetical protein AAFC00_001351 [Neodothiora populina]|uniref:SAP domain-containing protein n=1 Tax=Neodothiora populina TaxID=2781224 RepID=A0ABR3PNM2_9PEZI